MDALTNILLTVLISIIGSLGVYLMKKLEVLSEKLERILLSDISHSKDIEKNSEDIANHELRITSLEKK